MQVHVKLFAILRDAAGGAGDLTLDLPPGARAGDVAAPLTAQFPALAAHLPRVAYAVGRNYCSPDAPLAEGDEVALIPPVSGG